MNILITSDLHGNKNKLLEIVNKYPKHEHINAGDIVMDEDIYLDHNLIIVKGNCDFSNKLPLARVFMLEDKRFLLVHGHIQGVKLRMKKLVNLAKSMQVDYCIFGHTHKRYLKVVDNITFINPGSLGYYPYEYALLENDKVRFLEL